MNESVALWVVFNLFVVLMLALDLGVFHRKLHVVSIKEALVWTGVWITAAMIFNVFIYSHFGEEKGVEFFNVPQEYQHKVLFWGILGALVMRVIFIFSGIELIHRFHWLIYIFGSFLIYTGIKILLSDDTKIEPE